MDARDVHGLVGRTAYAADGARLGTVTGAYLDDATGAPSWITVEQGGLFRTTRTFVPLDGAEAAGDGVRTGVTGDAVRSAPHVDEDRVLTVEEEQGLLRHYGLDRPAAADEADPVTILSEEQVRTGTETVATTRAVLRRNRVVQERTFTVPLGRDEVQVVHEPLPEPRVVEPHPEQAPADEADDDWLVLYEERLVVTTEWVPVERVRLRTVGVRGEESVQVDVRRERVDVDVRPAADAPPPAGA